MVVNIMNAIKIAELAGVSKSTVYRALNGEKIKDSTKRRIMTVMKENNMTESFSGFGFAPQSVRLVALVLDSRERKCLAEVIECIKNCFVSNGFTVIDISAENILRSSEEAEKLVSGVNFHGYVFAGADVCEKCRDFIERAAERRPVVLVHSEISGKNIYNITTDSESVAGSAVSDLINKFGHKSFLCCSSESTDRTSYGKKLSSDIEKALRSGKDKSVSCDYLKINPACDGSELIADHLADRGSVTAIIALDESSAEQAAAAAEKLGLRIPEDISVIGYQNSGSAEAHMRNISSIDSKSETVADMALMLMVAALNGRNVTHSIKVPCTYNERRSTAPAHPRAAFIASALIGNYASA